VIKTVTRLRRAILPGYAFTTLVLSAASLVTPAWADVLADSTADFSSVQGVKNWHYGYFPAGNINSFTQLPTFNTSVNGWQHTTCCPPWTTVASSSGMHPNGSEDGGEEWAVREWVSTFNGDVVISGQLNKTDTNSNSTGVFGKIYVNHSMIWNQFIAGTDGVGISYSIPITLHPGDVIDFALAPNGVDYNDGTHFSATIATLYSQVTVDFGVPLTTVSASGFLHAVTGATPIGDITPLQPKFWRIPAFLSSYQLVRSFAPAIPIHLNLSDVYGYPGNNYNGKGAPWLNWTAFETFVRNTAAPLSGATNVIFDVWNEPDDINFPPGSPGYQEFWNGTIQQFYETYFHAWNALVAQLGSNVRTAGPTFTTYDHSGIQAFLDSCVANGCQVNSLTWHALNDSSDPTAIPPNVHDAITSFLQNPTYAPLHINRIDINEMIGGVFWHQPAGTLLYFSAFEQSGANAAARTCGFDSYTQCSNGTLNGLLTSDALQPLAVWWLQKYYADGATARVQSGASNPTIVGLASNGSQGSQPPQILIGYADFQASINNVSSTASVQLTLAHAGATTPSGSATSVGVRIEHIPDSGTAALPQIRFVKDLILPLNAGAGTLILPPLPLGDVFRITLLGAQTINFGAIANVNLAATPVTLTATADSGLAVSFASNTPSVCTVSGVTLTLIAAGTCSITASQPGNSSYAAAAPVTQTFTVVETIGVSPGSGSGSVQTFTGQVVAANGYHDLQWAQMLFAVATDGGGQAFCLVHYDVQGNKFWLYSDVLGFFVGPIAPGAASNLLQGSLCALNTSGSSVTGSEVALTVNANMVFKQALAVNIYMRAYTLEGVDTGWVQQGTWTTVAASLGTMTVVPSSGSVTHGTQQTFTLTYPDPPGFAGAAFGWEQFLVAVASNGGGLPYCYVHYDRGGNGLWMYSSDVGFFLGPVAPGTASSLLTSSACSVNTASATVQNMAGNLVLTVPVTLKSPMAGSQKLFERSLTVLNVDTGFVQTGTLTVN
jgi:hypothetical protein